TTTFSEERVKDTEEIGASEPPALEVDTYFAGTPETEPLVEQALEVPSFETLQTESHSTSPDTLHATIETPGYLEAAPAIQMESEPLVETPQPWTPPEAQTPAAPSEEFVTETMAELYLEQGHPEAAVEIYQRLVAQRPDDRQLAYRLHSLEEMLHAEPVALGP